MPNLFDTIHQNFQASKKNVNHYLSVGIIFMVGMLVLVSSI